MKKYSDAKMIVSKSIVSKSIAYQTILSKIIMSSLIAITFMSNPLVLIQNDVKKEDS